MADSIDRVFVKAISTIRALSTRTGYGSLPRPPVDSRIKLYGLYKQSTEGNVDGIMERPMGSGPEDQSARLKWDAWKSQQGISKTQAKRKYIAFLIDTMNKYASGHEARELLSELEYLWDQIKDVVPSPSLPMTPRLSTYGSSFAYDVDNSVLQKELAIALQKINQLEKDDKEWPVKKSISWILKLFLSITKRVLIDLCIVLMILNLIKYNKGNKVINKLLRWVHKLIQHYQLYI